MKVVGIPRHPSAPAYITGEFDIRYIHCIDEIPVYVRDRDYFVGGFRNFYSVLIADAAEERQVLERITHATANAKLCVSTSTDRYTSAIVHYLLDISRVRDPESRLELYTKKTRNQVRRSRESNMRIQIGAVPAGFYELYCERMRELGSAPKDQAWFDRLVRHFGDDVIAVSAFANDRLIGVNYCIRAGEYLLLMLNVSRISAWKEGVNNRLYDEMILWAIHNGISYVDFGPGTAGDASHNHFKEGFGATRRFVVDRQFGTLAYRLRDRYRRLRFAASRRFRRKARANPNLASYSNPRSIEVYDSEKDKWTEEYVYKKYFAPGASVLDLGCGTGRTSKRLLDLGMRVRAVDYSPTMIDRAREKYGKQITFDVMDAKQLAFPDGHFDIVFFSFNGLDYLVPEADRIKAIREIYRVLVPGGLFVFSSHNARFIPNSVHRTYAAAKSFLYGKIHPYRLEFHTFGRLLTYYISPQAQVRQLSENGFCLVELVSRFGADMPTVSRTDPYPTYVARKALA